MIHPVARVLVPYPRGLQTGGPEALHQLVDSLRRLGVEAWLWPVTDSRNLGRVADYECYEAPETTQMMDEPDTAVVFSEVYPQLSRLWKRAHPYCWWLSIDNSPYFQHRRFCENAWSDGERPIVRLARGVLSSQKMIVRDLPQLRRMTHLTQSNYAWKYIRRAMWLTPTMLGDYIPAEEEYAPAAARKAHKPSVAFNPSKGRALTESIRRLVGPTVEWLPIQGLDREGVSALLDRATVYLESGHQPGKDRLPREAALHGCVVLMLRRGAGGRNSQDLWIGVSRGLLITS